MPVASSSALKIWCMGDLRQHWTKAFLSALAVEGVVSRAAALAGVDRVTVHRRRKDDPDFNQACLDAMEEAADALEAEARRRAIAGTTEDIYHQGVVVGQKRVFSDSLLTLLLKGRRKQVFADRTELTGADGGPVKGSFVVTTGVPQPEDDEPIA